MATLNTLFIVDDDTNEHEFLSVLFNEVMPSLSYQFYSSGFALVKTLTPTTAQLPDAILLDINMPGIGGFEILAVMRNLERLRHIPIIIYSTARDPQSVQIAYDLGATYYLPKPDTVIELREILKTFATLPFNAAQRPDRAAFVLTAPRLY